MREVSGAARETWIPIGNQRLFCREIGQGRPIVVLHGGPDFDHRYLLPELDALADSHRLIYYDQRGRGRSAEGVQPEDVTLDSEMEDLDCVRRHFGLESVALLGHSWGGVLAMEYAIRHAARVSHLILMNTAPASAADFAYFRSERRVRTPADIEELVRLSSTSGYRAGDPESVTDYYRVHFRSAVKREDHLDRLIERFRSTFEKEGILKARAIEDRLMDETASSRSYDLLPALARLNAPTLVLHGDNDFVPRECSEHIAGAIPGASLVVLEDCGHFSYLERTEEVRGAIGQLLR